MGKWRFELYWDLNLPREVFISHKRTWRKLIPVTGPWETPGRVQSGQPLLQGQWACPEWINYRRAGEHAASKHAPGDALYLAACGCCEGRLLSRHSFALHGPQWTVSCRKAHHFPGGSLQPMTEAGLWPQGETNFRFVIYARELCGGAGQD